MYKMAILSEIKSHSDAISCLKEFSLKTIERPVKGLKNIDSLVELTFYEQLSVIKKDQAFKGYEMSYKVEIVKKRSNCTIRSE